MFDRHRAAVRARLASSGLHRAGPGSVSWKINREIVVVAGWGRAILLQFAHPLIAEGIRDHSGFRGGALARLDRFRSTIGAMQSLTFGDDEAAIGAAAGINCIHDRVYGSLAAPAGNFEAGERYSAHAPELLRWVHATLLESIPMTYQAFVGPLTDEERDRYCAEATIMEPLLDIPGGSLPRDTADLSAYMAEMLVSGRIAVTATSRMLARALLFPKGYARLLPGLGTMRRMTIGSLPAEMRSAYGFEWGPRDQRAFERWTAGIRRLRRLTPRIAREWPIARRATGETRPQTKQPQKKQPQKKHSRHTAEEMKRAVTRGACVAPYDPGRSYDQP